VHVSQVCFSVGRTKGQHYVISLCAGLPIDFHKEFGLKTDDRVQPKLREEQPINKGRWVGDEKVIPRHQDILPIFSSSSIMRTGLMISALSYTNPFNPEQLLNMHNL